MTPISKLSYRSKLLASHAAVALVVSAITLFVVDRAVTQRMEEQVDRRLEAHARAIPSWFERSGHPNRLAKRLAEVIGARVTFADRDGAVLGESDADGDRAALAGVEVRAALSGKTGKASHFSEREGQEVRYVAVPGPDSSVIRLGLPLGEITETTSQIRTRILAGAAVSILVALILAALVARALTSRLRNTTAMAERLGRGEWDKITASRNASDEIGVLSTTLARAAERLKSVDSERRELLSDIAHEIRTPVTSIRGYAETLTQGGADEATTREFLQTIHRNALRIGGLLEDLLELEALEAQSASLPGSREHEVVGVADVVKNALSTLAGRAEASGATVRCSGLEGLYARGDADAIERIVLNLVSNALSYGGEGVEIDVVGREDSGELVLSVVDNGPGVAETHRQRIFERFFRGEEGRSRDRGGSGLGLAIARQLAQSMGGSLYLAEEQPKGLHICLRLPAEASL